MENMDKKENKEISVKFAQTVQKQHNCLLVTIPKAICRRINLQRRDLIVFEYFSESGIITISKFETKREQHNGSKRNTRRYDFNRNP